MNILRKFPERLIYVLSVAVLVMAPGLLPVQAKDTDIYLLAPSTSTDDKPNVLIILDNSGSMSDPVPAAQVAYDASVDYCDSSEVNAIISGAAGGIPSGCAGISGRIYWAFPDNSGNAEPPDMSSDQWFTATKNKCLKSLDPNAFLSVSGKYSGDKIARWYGSGSNSNRGWKTLNNKTNGTITHVDCEDDGTADGQTAGDNTFPQNSTSTAYSTSNAFRW
jgi:type IV pilus assembly protein PilY1